MSSARYWHEEKFSGRKVSEMTDYAFVLDANNKQLAPTKNRKPGFLFVGNEQHWSANIHW